MRTPDENKAVWRRFVEEIPNKRNFDAIDVLVDENVVFWMPDPIRGRAALKDEINARLATFSDVRVEIAELVAEGDRAIGLVNINGTMTGEYMGQDVTGKALSLQVAHFLRFTGGRIVEDRQISDSLSVLVQLGLIEVPQPA